MKRTFLVLVASLAVLTAAGVQPAVAAPAMLSWPSIWTTSTPLPAARSRLAAATLDSKIYVAGGLDADGVASADVWAFSPTTSQWTSRASLPAPRARFYLAVTGRNLYTIGGGTNEVDRYNPATNAWTAVAPMPWTVDLPS